MTDPAWIAERREALARLVARRRILLWAYYTGLKRGEILPPERLAVAKQ